MLVYAKILNVYCMNSFCVELNISKHSEVCKPPRNDVGP